MDVVGCMISWCSLVIICFVMSAKDVVGGVITLSVVFSLPLDVISLGSDRSGFFRLVVWVLGHLGTRAYCLV